jgi:hypothetical protein
VLPKEMLSSISVVSVVKVGQLVLLRMITFKGPRSSNGTTGWVVRPRRSARSPCRILDSSVISSSMPAVGNGKFPYASECSVAFRVAEYLANASEDELFR